MASPGPQRSLRQEIHRDDRSMCRSEGNCAGAVAAVLTVTSRPSGGRPGSAMLVQADSAIAMVRDTWRNAAGDKGEDGEDARQNRRRFEVQVVGARGGASTGFNVPSFV